MKHGLLVRRVFHLKEPVVGARGVDGGEPLVRGVGVGPGGEQVQVTQPHPAHLQEGTGAGYQTMI